MCAMNHCGERITYKNGNEAEIIRYGSNVDIDVMFKNGYIAKNRQYVAFKNNKIKDKYFPTLYGVGYFGEGEYFANDKGLKNSQEYISWRNMLKRCYDGIYTVKNPSYVGCEVCTEWHNFQNFAKWFNDNKWTNDFRLCVDKDILKRGNKIYSPNNCCLVGFRINSLFVNAKKTRGKYPLGVKKCSESKNFESSCSILNEEGKRYRKHIGNYSTPSDAFMAYKIFKESYIKEIASNYNKKYDNFPKNVYMAMLNYTIDIND